MEAPTREQEVLDLVEQTYGFVPNLLKEMAGASPAVAQVYLDANAAIEEASLTGAEQQAVILAVSAYNDCHYCTAAHATVGQMEGLAEDDIQAILDGGLPGDERLSRLVQATRRTLEQRGWLEADDLAELEAQGIDRGQVYEIVALIGIKTISNYVNHINKTEIDPQFQ
jgi:AhpD family alkylhydroperoxidase